MALILLCCCLFEVNTQFKLTEKLAHMTTLCGTAAGENIFKEVEKTLIWYNLKWTLLRCVISDGGQICVEQKKT